MKYKKIFYSPEILTHQYISFFLREVEPLFKMRGCNEKGIFVDTSKTRKINILGLLLLCKFFEYSIQKDCFLNPKCNLDVCKGLLREIDKNAFKPMFQQFMHFRIPEDYSMEFKQNDGVFIAPMILNRGQSREKTEVSYRNKIKEYYNYNKTITFVILQCLGEIASNFSEHAVLDTKSIMVASGNKDYFEIACADTGDGIVSTLGPILEGHKKNSYSVIQEAFEKGVSSKLDSGHMGCGLWLIDKFAAATNGELCVYSEGGYVHRRYSRIDKGECPFWQGTIIYLRIPLRKAYKLKEVIDELKSQYGKNKIQKV